MSTNNQTTQATSVAVVWLLGIFGSWALVYLILRALVWAAHVIGGML